MRYLAKTRGQPSPTLLDPLFKVVEEPSLLRWYCAMLSSPPAFVVGVGLLFVNGDAFAMFSIAPLLCSSVL